MMGRQFGFYAHPDDYGELATGLGSLGAVAIGRRSPNGLPMIRDIADPGRDVNAFLTRPEYFSELHSRSPGTSDEWLCSIFDDCLIELSIWLPRDGLVRPGRVYYIPRYLVESEEYDKPPEFIEFAEQVRKWLRRWCKKREGLWLSPVLAARFDNGQLIRKGPLEALELLS